MKRLHIVGCPRSGTTLMMELVSTCFRSDGFSEHEASIFTEPEGAFQLFFSKQPSDIKRIKKILTADPNLFTICMMRDPRSVISSVHRSKPGIYFCNYRVWKECDTAARRLLGHPRFFRVRYEDLVADGDGIQQQIMNRFPFLEKVHPFSQYLNFANPSEKSLKAMGGLREVTTSRIYSWQKHLPRVKSQLAKHPEMLKALVEYGYEKDDEWTRVLEDVVPVEHECRYPDKEFILKTMETKIRYWLKSTRYIRRRKLK